MQGIYKITNKINNKCYIGKSKNIEARWKEHKWRMNSLDEINLNKPLYRAFKKYGLNNFSFEVIEELDNYEADANEREKYWIKFYNSYGSENGYNATYGGDGGLTVDDPRSIYGKLTTDEVIYLRKRYIECKYPSTLIYEKEFQDKITKRGFQAIWLGENANNIMPEIFTEENKKRQMDLSRAYEGVLRRKISLEEKRKIKDRVKKGEAVKTIWRNEYQNIYSYGGFRDMVKAESLDERIDFNAPLSPL